MFVSARTLLFGTLTGWFFPCRSFSFSLLLLFWGAVGQARTEESALTFAGSVLTAQVNNRELQAARFAVDQARGRLVQSGRWQNPELAASGMSDFAFGNEGAAAFSVGLAQNFPLTARLGLAREIGRMDVERALLEVLNHERLLREKVRLAYLRAVESATSAGLWAVIDQEEQKIAADVQARLAVGQGSTVEVALSTAARARAWNALSEARAEADGALMELKTLLGFPASHPLRLRDDLASILAQLTGRLRERPSALHRPDAKLLVLLTDRAELEIRLAQAESWEGITIGVEYINEQGIDEPEGLGTDQFFGVTVSLPLPLWQNNKGRVEEKTALRQEMQARTEAIRLEITNELAAAWQLVNLLQERARELDAQAVQPLRQSEAELKTGFGEGRVELRDWLAVRAQLAELELTRTRTNARLAEACIHWQAVVGEAGSH